MYCFSTFDMIKKLREKTSPHERKETRHLVDTLKKKKENNNLLCLRIEDIHLRMYHKLLMYLSLFPAFLWFLFGFF